MWFLLSFWLICSPQKKTVPVSKLLLRKAFAEIPRSVNLSLPGNFCPKKKAKQWKWKPYTDPITLRCNITQHETARYLYRFHDSMLPPIPSFGEPWFFRESSRWWNCRRDLKPWRSPCGFLCFKIHGTKNTLKQNMSEGHFSKEIKTTLV